MDSRASNNVANASVSLQIYLSIQLNWFSSCVTFAYDRFVFGRYSRFDTSMSGQPIITNGTFNQVFGSECMWCALDTLNYWYFALNKEKTSTQNAPFALCTHEDYRNEFTFFMNNFDHWKTAKIIWSFFVRILFFFCCLLHFA